MPKPTRAEMAALVERLRIQYNVPPRAENDWRWLIADRNAAADALEALMQERAQPVFWIDTVDCDGKEGPVYLYAAQSHADMTPLYAAPPAKPAGELPPLPDPSFLLGISEYYTESQMRAYALRAIQESR